MASMTASMTASHQGALSTPLTLLTIPYELRNLIYLDLFSASNALIMRLDAANGGVRVADSAIHRCYSMYACRQLLQVCKQMRGEALPFFSRHHTALLNPQCCLSSLPRLLVTKSLKHLTLRLRLCVCFPSTTDSFFFSSGQTSYNQRQKAMALPELQTLAFITEETFPQLQRVEIKAHTRNDQDDNLYLNSVVTRAFIVQEQYRPLQYLVMDTKCGEHERMLKLLRSKPELEETEIDLEDLKDEYIERVDDH